MAVKRIVPNLRAYEPASNRDFYERVLGLELAMDMEWIVTFVSPTNRTAEISLIRRDASAPVHPDVSVEVDDVGAVHASAVELGFEIVHPLTEEPWGVRRFFARDPNGVVVNILSHLN